jgi:hypothetical protein
MKKRHYINFHVPRAQGARFRTLMEQVDCLDVWEEPHNERALPHLAHVFDAEEPRFSALINLLKREGIEWFERLEHVYTAGELRVAPLLEFSVNLAPRELGSSYPGQFDASTGCPRCKTGSRQVGPVRVAPEYDDDESGFPRRGMLCQSIECDYFVRGNLHVALAAAGLRGLELMEGVSAKGEPLGWWQMIPRHVMPRMSRETLGVVRGRDKDGRPTEGCRHCDRDNYFHTTTEPLQITYRRSDLGDGPLPEATYTWECFGLSCFDKGGHIARPQVLMSARVFDVFRQLKVRGAEFTPVRIIEG